MQMGAEFRDAAGPFTEEVASVPAAVAGASACHAQPAPAEARPCHAGGPHRRAEMGVRGVRAPFCGLSAPLRPPLSAACPRWVAWRCASMRFAPRLSSHVERALHPLVGVAWWALMTLCATMLWVALRAVVITHLPELQNPERNACGCGWLAPQTGARGGGDGQPGQGGHRRHEEWGQGAEKTGRAAGGCSPGGQA